MVSSVKYVSLSLNAPAPKMWASPMKLFHPKVLPAASCAPDFGRLTAAPATSNMDSGGACVIESGQTEFGNSFLYSSCPSGSISACTLSLSTLPSLLGKRKPLRRNASPKGFSFGKAVWQVTQLVLYLRANEGTACAVLVLPKKANTAARTAARHVVKARERSREEGGTGGLVYVISPDLVLGEASRLALPDCSWRASGESRIDCRRLLPKHPRDAPRALLQDRLRVYCVENMPQTIGTQHVRDSGVTLTRRSHIFVTSINVRRLAVQERKSAGARPYFFSSRYSVPRGSWASAAAWFTSPFVRSRRPVRNSRSNASTRSVRWSKNPSRASS